MMIEGGQLEFTLCPNCNTLYDPEQHTDAITLEVQCPGCSAHVHLLE